MAISDVYTARSGSIAVNASTATPLHSVVGTAALRGWVVGVRVDIITTTAGAGANVLFQLCRPGNTMTGTTATPVPGPHDFSAPASIMTNYTAWSTAPTVGVVLWEQELPFTSGLSWEEFPPAGYEWQIPAIANGSANAGVHMFVDLLGGERQHELHHRHHLLGVAIRVLCAHIGPVPVLGDFNQHGLYPSTARALAAFAPGAELVDVSGDEYGYWHQIRARWTGEQDLVLVEQDVEITADVLPAFAACPSPWCTFSYELRPGWVPSTDACGCARYRAQLQRDVPAEVIEAGWGACGVCGDPAARPGMGRPCGRAAGGMWTRRSWPRSPPRGSPSPAGTAAAGAPEGGGPRIPACLSSASRSPGPNSAQPGHMSPA